mmetsp:Transcript_1467/g.2912  ORF Transcript_1467/g.2912 Transcript_1467/m.2912 type:complete len:480 (-) Transcript_1467:247-1686(-)|eukprot:CAMPEP_0119076238 /NCGR_PEP_ID=MMETSP1178-20130426/85264_1 /TAXON_ID=33656 /ORGANISM="unid sp, Strain CCMP2000" /LENGTH=479 /DNA_ID=CAMNT_0007058505 /DNA_START=1 /DNA_END=1440 /DNA_ORIENTATION=+
MGFPSDERGARAQGTSTDALTVIRGDHKMDGAIEIEMTAGIHAEQPSKVLGQTGLLDSGPKLMAQAMMPTKTILALITASDGVCDKAPVLEFRLKAGNENDDVTACHRVRAYIFNQTVSEGTPLFKDSSMCGGRSHLFDLGVLNLTYYGASAWDVFPAGPLPRGRISMIMIDSDETCARFDVGTVAPFRLGDNLPPLGCFGATVELASTFAPSCSPARIKLVWQEARIAPPAVEKTRDTVSAVQEDPKPQVTKSVLSAALPLSAAPSYYALSVSPPYPAVEPAQPEYTRGTSAYLPIAPSKHATRRICKPRTKLSRRMAATLAFFFDRDNMRDGGPRIRSGPCRALRDDLSPGTSRPTNAAALKTAPLADQHKLNVNDMLADLARSDQEVEGCDEDPEAVMDLVAALMEEDDEQAHSRDAFDLADCLMNEFDRSVPTATTPDCKSLPCAIDAHMPSTTRAPFLHFAPSSVDSELPPLVV